MSSSDDRAPPDEFAPDELAMLRNFFRDEAQDALERLTGRLLGAGTIIGSGTVSNKDRAAGSSCLAEIRMIETLKHGEPRTPFLKHEDRIRIEMQDATGASVFGAIDQRVDTA